MNAKGIKFVQERTRPLAVATMDRAAEVIAKALKDRDERIAAGKPLKTDTDFEAQGRHFAWLIGFDALVEDRAAIHHVVDKVA